MSDQVCCSSSLIQFPLLAPTNLVATPTDDTIALTWTASAGATSYVVSWSGGGETGSATVTASPYTITGLTPATEYDIAVVAMPDPTSTTDTPSAPARVTATTSGPQLAPPTALASPSQTTTTVALSWTASPNATSYGIEQKLTSGSVWSEIGTATGTTHNATGLTADTSYDFRVAARASGYTDSDWSNVLTQETAAA